MRGGRRRQSSSSAVLQQPSRMALRKQMIKDAPCESQQSDENTREDEAFEDRDENDELSSSILSPVSTRDKRRRERENKNRPKDMTEEEMMDLALRLSEKEASITALRLQKEEEAMMKALQESMVSQTQPCPAHESQSLLAEAEASVRLCSRRKLSYANRKLAAEESSSQETDVNGGCAAESQIRSKKRRRREGSPLLEMPDLSQTQKISSQASFCSSEPLDLQLDSPQSSDSTQIEDCKSPVFPLTGCRAEVQVPRLSQNLLDSCRASGFVLCSQDSCSVTQISAQPSSPTFPKSPKNSRDVMLARSPMFSETDPEDDTETQLIPDVIKSPVFGGSTLQKTSTSACRPQICYSGFTLSSQESLSASVRPPSPVFLDSPGQTALCKSPESERGHTELSHGSSASRVFDRTNRQPDIHPDVQKQHSSKSLKQDHKTNHNPDVQLNKSSKSDFAEEELTETFKDGTSVEMELSSDMKLHWSDNDEDDDVMPAGSPSPVFPEEKLIPRTESQTASLDNVTKTSPGTTGTNCRPSSSSTSAGQQSLQNSQPDWRLVRSQGTDGPSVEPAGTTVNYYWGVPFCPRGLNPDSYTQVILAQMEVYEKSLKQAQRCLLRKAEWGEAVLPQLEKSPLPESQSPELPQQDVSRSFRRGLRLKGKRLSEDDDTSPPAEVEEEEKTEGEEEQRRESEEEEKKEEGREQVDSDDCEVCPETQVSNNEDDWRQDLMMDTDAAAEPHAKSLPEPDIQLIPQGDSPGREERHEEDMEVDDPVERNSARSLPVSSSGDERERNVTKEQPEEDGEVPDVEEMRSPVFQRSASPELELAAATQSPQTSVDCPLCQGSFPASEIEMHAAYCDGEVAVVHERRPKADCFQVSLKLRRKRTRRDTREDEEEPSNTGKNQEKCYVCQKAVSLRDYSRHTELCIQRQESKTATKGNLLSALDQTDTKDSEAGPSGSKLQPDIREVIDLRDDDDEDEENQDSVSGLRISNSPIRAFTPISEATDCLIDFKKQKHVKKLSQRRR